ncbi:hypothetical protein [Sabulicella glaciei]|uniref:hypothetical protein n=1 Tax=Sabulicella glaciei TaxID=2984948 RepID=UPI00265A88D5|nr:hypothetical protein [Roseococcus sp. MDT2-1-1]
MLDLTRRAARVPISARIHFTTLAAVIGLMALVAVEVTGCMRDLEEGRVTLLRGGRDGGEQHRRPLPCRGTCGAVAGGRGAAPRARCHPEPPLRQR